MNHKQKLTLARSMMSKEEIKDRVPPFQSRGWTARRAQKQTKAARIISNQQRASVLRRQRDL